MSITTSVEDQVDRDQHGRRFRQRGAGRRQHDHVGPAFLGQLGRAHQGRAVAALGNRHHGIAIVQQGGRNAVDRRVGIGHGRHAGTEELVLRIRRHDAGGAMAVELDLAGTRQDVERLLHRFGVQVVAQVQQRVDGAAADLVHQVRRQVVLRRLVVQAGQGERQALRQLELELVPAVIAQGAAEPHHGRLGHLRALGQRGDIGAHGAGRVVEHGQRDLALRFGERVELGADGIEQHQSSGRASSRHCSPSRPIRALAAAGPQVPEA
jgi:hypothetical protein